MHVLSWRNLPSVLFPLRTRETETSNVHLVRWCLHLIVWAGVLSGLWWLNHWTGIEQSLRSPWPHAHRVWLPFMALSIYLVGWLSIGLWQALRTDVVEADWPDIDNAWDAARHSLAAANVDAIRTPLYLFLGPLPPLESLGATALPSNADAPFRVFARHGAIYLACDQLARLGAQRPDKTLQARLHHLGKLLVRDRAPSLPIQGIVVVVQFTAAQNEDELRRVMRDCQADLDDLRRAVGLEAPLYLTITGLALPSRTHTDDCVPWLQRFPPLPDLDPAEIVSMYQHGVEHLCATQIPQQLLKDFDTNRTLEENTRLYQTSRGIHAWRRRLESLLVEGLQNDHAEPGLVAGCYFIPDGLAAADAHRLTRSLCDDLESNRRDVLWTAATLAADQVQQRRTRAALWLGAVGLLAAMVAGGMWLTWRS